MLSVIIKRLSTISGAPIEGAESTRILLHSDGVTLVATRNIRLRGCRVITTCDGTTGDFASKANRLGQLEDEMFETFARLQLDELTRD